MKYVVVGAGIVGLATAYELVMAGHSVSVMDANRNPGQGASGGNGAQLSYSYVQPLADPAIWAQLPKLLLDKNSPLRFSPSFNTHQWQWLFEFMKACTKKQSEKGTRDLLRLAALSRQRFEAMMGFLKVMPEDCDYQENGKLVLYRSARSFSGALAQLDFQKSLGLGGQQFAISGAQAVDLEPALEGTEKNIVGAIHTPSECVVNTQKLCDLLANRLRSFGVRFEMEIELSQLSEKAAEDEQTYWVICTGADSYEILKTLGVRVPVYPIKGYSITLPCKQAKLLKLSVTDSAIKTVFAPLADAAKPAIRVAGFAEIVGMNRYVQEEKIRVLLAAAKNTFPRCAFDAEIGIAKISPWAGLRPATPTGIPIVGQLQGLPRNVLVNIGHGALGLTLAFGTAFELCKVADSVANSVANSLLSKPVVRLS
jgi:D-amino-acid dehydrogenase